jgi:hypothetical protein
MNFFKILNLKKKFLEFKYKLPDINDLSEDDQILEIMYDNYEYKFIKNPTEKVKYALVEENPDAIIYIKEPSENLCYLAIKLNPYSIIGIKNATEDMEIEAVKNLNYNDLVNYNRHVRQKLKSPKAAALYDKLKSVRNIIK